MGSNLHGLQFGDLGEEQHPVPVAHDRGQPGSQDDATINRMAGRIVQTYLAADSHAHHLGETFYGHDPDTTGGAPLCEGPRDAPVWALYAVQDGSEDWRLVSYGSGLTFDEAEDLACELGLTGRRMG